MLSMGVFSLFFCELEAHSQLCVSLTERTKEVRLAILRLALLEIIDILNSFVKSFLQEIICVVDRGFRSVREAMANDENIRTAFSTWSNRLFVTYTDPIPAIEVSTYYSHACYICEYFSYFRFAFSQIEIVLAGERGPRRLDE